MKNPTIRELIVTFFAVILFAGCITGLYAFLDDQGLILPQEW